MKKYFSLVLLAFTGFIAPVHIYAQSVAINADSSAADPSAILDLKSTSKGMLVPRMTMTQRNAVTTPATGLLIYQTDNTAGYYYYDGTAWTALKSTGGGGGSDPFWTASGNNIFTTNTGNVGIGTSTTDGKLTVMAPSPGYGFTHTDGTAILSTYVGGGTYGAWLGTRSNHPLFFFTNNSEPRMSITETGNVGVGVTKPANKLQVGSFTGNFGITNFDFVIAGNNNFLGMRENPGVSEVFSSNNIGLIPTGYVGVLTRGPLNKLQVGDIGNAGFVGNDIAFGNGTEGSALGQTASVMQLVSSTDIVFRPHANQTGGGKVGINTSSPIAPLDVESYTALDYLNSGPGVAYFGFGGDGSGGPAPVTGGAYAIINTSIYANQAIMGRQFDVFSDARIKNVKGISNSSMDLKTIRALQITDYQYKDKIKYGPR